MRSVRTIDHTTLWGLTPVAEEDGLVFPAAEGSPEQYIVRLRKDADKRLDLISYGASTPADVDALAECLGRSGMRLVNEPGALPSAGGGHGFRFFDVDGRTIEVSADVATRQHRRIVVAASLQIARWQVAHELGDVAALIARIAALTGQPA